MPTFDELERIARNPEPEYPEYAAVCEAAREEFGPFVSPQELDELTAVVHRHRDDWCIAVLGRPVPDPFRVPVTEARMLIIADRRDLNPPLPQRIQRWRTEDAQRRAAEQVRRDQLAEAARQRWAEARAQCSVEVEVRPNARGGRSTWRQDGPLRHVVALTDARSGRTRRHPAGRALCETPPARYAAAAERTGRATRHLSPLPRTHHPDTPRRNQVTRRKAMTAPTAVRTTRCRHCRRKVVAAHLDNPPSQTPLPTPPSGRFDFERMAREIAVQDIRWHCYLIQPNPEHPAEIVAFQLRPMQIPGAREHRQPVYRLHYCPTGAS